MAFTSWTRGIGSEVSPNMSLEKQLELAGLNWEVATSPISYGCDFQHNTIDGEYRKAIYRSDTGMLLDVGGKQWRPFQNRDIVSAFHNFCEKAGLQMNHLGSLEDGRTIFASANLPSEINVRQVGDIVRARVILINYHKVGFGLSIRLQMERLVCLNGMAQPVRIGNRVVTHVGNFDSTKIVQILEGCQQNFADFGRDAEKLAAKSMSMEEAHLILIKEFGDPSKGLHEQPAIVQTCLRLFDGGGRGSDMLSSYNTAWGLLNSITEFYNHHSQIRGGTATHLNSLLLGSKAQKQLSFQQRLLAIC